MKSRKNKLALIINGANPSSTFVDTFSDVATAQKTDVQSVSSIDACLSISTENGVSVVVNNSVVSEADYFFIKSFKDDSFRTFLIARALQPSGRLFSDEANLMHSQSADKMSAMLTLAQHGLCVPETILCTPQSFKSNYEWITQNLTYPCVLKKTGSRGRNVWKVKDADELIIRLNTDDKLTLIQEYIPNDHDFRVFVFNDQCVAAVRRSSVDGFYNNVSQGGKAESVTLTPEETAACVQATRAMGLKISGVDFVRHMDKMIFFEVNKNPQMDIFSDALGYDLQQKYAHLILEYFSSLVQSD